MMSPVDARPAVLRRRLRGALLLAAAASLSLLGTVCTGGSDQPEASDAATTASAPAATHTTPQATPGSTPPAPASTVIAGGGPTPAGAPPPELVDAAVRALLAAMQGGVADPFAWHLDGLPTAITSLLDALGLDLRLGAALADAPDAVAVDVVVPGSPAARGGLAPGDSVTAIDGTPVLDAAALRAAVAAVAPGTRYILTVGRGAGEVVELERDADDATSWRSDLLRSLALGLLIGDATGADLPPSLLGELMEETPDGLRVFAVFPGSPADAAGLRAGDYVLAIGGRPLVTLNDLEALMSGTQRLDGDVNVTLRRGGEKLHLLVDTRVGGLGGDRETR